MGGRHSGKNPPFPNSLPCLVIAPSLSDLKLSDLKLDLKLADLNYLWFSHGRNLARSRGLNRAVVQQS